MTDPGSTNGIRITNREVYDGLLQVRDRLSALEHRVDLVLRENIQLRKRVARLEWRFYAVLGVLAAGLTSLGIGMRAT